MMIAPHPQPAAQLYEPRPSPSPPPRRTRERAYNPPRVHGTTATCPEVQVAKAQARPASVRKVFCVTVLMPLEGISSNETDPRLHFTAPCRNSAQCRICVRRLADPHG